MRFRFTKIVPFFMAMAMLMGIYISADAQTRRPRLRRAAPRVVSIVPVGTNLKVRLNETLSSKESRVGDSFTTTVISPTRFDEATARGHVSSIRKSGKVKGRTVMTLAFDTIQTSDGRNGTLHGYVTR